MDSKDNRERVACPFCGYKMPIEKEADAVSHGLWVKCKGRNCGKRFEIRLPDMKKDK